MTSSDAGAGSKRGAAVLDHVASPVTPAMKRRAPVTTVFSDKCIGPLMKAHIGAMAIAPTGDVGLVINRGAGRMLDLVEGKPGARVKCSEAHPKRDMIMSAALSNFGIFAVTASMGSVATWDGRTGACRGWYDFEDYGIESCIQDPSCGISADGSRILVVTYDRADGIECGRLITLKSCVDGPCGETSSVFKLGNGIVPRHLCVGADGSRFSYVAEHSGERKTTVRRGMVDYETKMLNHTQVCGTAMKENEEKLQSDVTQILNNSRHPIVHLAASRTRLVVGGYEEAYVLKFGSGTSGEAVSSAKLVNFPHAIFGRDPSKVIAENGVVACGDGEAILLYDPDTGLRVQKLRVEQCPQARSYTSFQLGKGPVAISADGNTVIAGCAKGTGQVWLWKL